MLFNKKLTYYYNIICCVFGTLRIELNHHVKEVLFMTFGEKLKSLRKQNGWTMEELANRLSDDSGRSIKKGRVSIWESGQNEPNFRVVQSIGSVFNVSIDYFKDNAGPLSKYVKDDRTKQELISIYNDLIPKRRINLLNYAKEQINQQNN